MSKVKIKVNEELTSIFNYVNSEMGVVLWSELIQYCIDYGLYKELYLNHFIIERLVTEHNEKVKISNQKNINSFNGSN